MLALSGDITSLTFSEDKYLVSTSADGTLCLFRTKDWSVLRRFKGHKVPPLSKIPHSFHGLSLNLLHIAHIRAPLCTPRSTRKAEWR